MKTKKLNLNELKVESFVTSLNEKELKTVKGQGSFSAIGGGSCDNGGCCGHQIAQMLE